MSTRLLTAAVALPALFGVIYAGVEAVSAVAVLAALIAGWELAGLGRTDATTPRNPGVAIAPAALVAVAAIIVAADRSWLWWLMPVSAAASVAIALGWRLSIRPRPPMSLAALIYPMAAIYVGSLLAHAPALRDHGSGLEWLLIAVLVTFATDSAAYAAGSAVGRRKLAPAISKSKTWEGAIAGLLAGIGAAAALSAILDTGISVSAAAGLGAAMATAGTLGDLAESALKRRAGAKDAGSLLPGHGGILDRLDSLAPNLAVVYWVAIATGAQS